MRVTAPCYGHSDYWRYFDVDYSGLRVLDIGSSIGSFVKVREFDRAARSVAHAASYVTLDINVAARPAVAADAHRLPFADHTFDVVVANNVLEHLREPSVGIAEMRRVLKDGGRLFYTVPFLYPVHEAPHDFTRFTQFGLRQLFREFAAVEVHALGGWFSTMAQLTFLLTRAADHVHLGGPLRLLMYPLLWVLVQFDRWDRSGAFTRGYYGRLRR